MEHQVTIKEDLIGSEIFFSAACSCKMFRSKRTLNKFVASLDGVDHLNNVDEANKYDIAP